MSDCYQLQSSKFYLGNLNLILLVTLAVHDICFCKLQFVELNENLHLSEFRAIEFNLNLDARFFIHLDMLCKFFLTCNCVHLYKHVKVFLGLDNLFLLIFV